MGEYYCWLNLDRRKYIDPIDFDLGCKPHESQLVGNGLIGALYSLLSSEWKGDDIIWLGDENDNDREEYDKNRTLMKLLKQRKEYGEDGKNEVGYDWDYLQDYYEDVSGLFKEAELKVREEMQVILEYKNGKDENYIFDPSDPYRGLFERKTASFRFTVNHSKKEFFDITKTYTSPEKNSKSKSFNVNPLPVLMAFGRSMDTGIWLGDNIEVTDEKPPDDYMDKSSEYADLW